MKPIKLTDRADMSSTQLIDLRPTTVQAKAKRNLWAVLQVCRIRKGELKEIAILRGVHSKRVPASGQRGKLSRSGASCFRFVVCGLSTARTRYELITAK